MAPQTVLLLALVAGAWAVPIDVRRFDEDTSCSRTCSGAGKFRYEPGKTYEFLYETGSRTGIEGAAEDKSKLQIMATVHIEVLSPCEFVLKMKEVRLMEVDPQTPSRAALSPGTREFARSLQSNPLRFGFQDGRIESVCPEDGDPLWVVNVKRGVLSTFQNVMASLDRDERVTETDVAGECDAEYKVVNSNRRWSRATTVKKTKNLLGCRNRHGYNSAVRGIPYHAKSEIQSLPLMKSRHECEQQIDGGLLISATCTESHVFRPFSKGSNGAMTETTQKLKYKTDRAGVQSRPDFIRRRSDLNFEHSPVKSADSSSLKDEAEDKLASLCRNTQEDIRPETPQLFAELVHLIRDLDYDSLRDLYRRVRDRQFCHSNQERTRKFFMDAIPMVGTKASVRFIQDLISKDIVDGMESEIWVTSLAFIANPSRDMIAEIKPLLRSKPTASVLLSVSALVNNYCQLKSCDNDYEVSEIVSILEDNLGHQCDVRGNDADKILLSLRAIGNTGHAMKAVPTLNRCFSKADLPMEVRLSAVNAFRHMSCKADMNNVMNLFRNREEDSELRIAAYLAVIECPTQWVLEQVKQTLESEEVTQVGSFVWTHLTNLMETSDPHKQEIRRILEDETLSKEFDVDKRKYSRNYEGSVFIEKLNTGAKAESNIIWSSKSFVPRSGMLNLTVDLFGHAINLVEIGGRVEGLEYYLESLFGPEGILQNPEAKEVWRRSKREIVRRDKLDRIKSRYGITSDELSGSLYMRMFGNELQYLSLGGKSKKSNFNLMDMLLKLSKQNSYELTQNMMFMDSTIAIPTSVGIPLKVTVNGTASVDLKVSGKMDVRKATSRPSNLHIEGVVQPSGAVEVASSMVLDAYVVRSGLKMVTTLHSSTASNGKIEIKNGQILNVEFDSPREKMEIINLDTKFFILHRETEKEQRMIDVNRKLKTVCSGQRLASLTGLEICGNLGFSNASMKDEAPYFPLTGPLSLGINLYKRDSHSGYVFSARYSSDSSLKTARVSFNTPGSREDRHLETELMLDTKGKKLELNLMSPWKKAALKGSFQNEKTLKKASATLLIDKQREYSVNGEVKINHSGKRTKFIPLLEISAPSMKTKTIGGAVERVGDQALEIDITMQNIVKDPINIRSNVVNTNQQKSVSGSFSKGKEMYSALYKLLMKTDKNILAYNATVNMKCPRGEYIDAEASLERNDKKTQVRIFVDKVVQNPVKLEGSVTKVQSKRLNKHILRVDVETPVIKFDAVGSVDQKKSRKPIIASKLTVNYQVPKMQRDRVTISSKFKNLSTKSLSNYDIVLNTNFRKNQQYNFETQAKFELSPTNMDTKFELRYGDNRKDEDKKITFSQSAMNRLKGFKRDGSLKIDLKYPAMDMNYVVKGTHLHSNSELNTNVAIRYGSNDQISASVKYKDDLKKKNSMFGEAKLEYPGRQLKLTSNLNKITDRHYNNTIDVVWGKGGKVKIESTYRNPTRQSYAVESAIHVAKQPEIILSGTLNPDLENLNVEVGATVGKKVYQVKVADKKKRGTFEGELDLKYPSRRILAGVNADWRDKYTGKVDLKWDADNNKRQRLTGSGELDLRQVKDIRGSFSGQYVDRQIKANIRHQAGDKYVSHADVLWGPGKPVVIDASFADVKEWSNRKLEGSLLLTSPFKYAEFLELKAEHSVDSLQFQTSADIAWNRADKISSSLTIKRPIILENISGKLSVNTPFPDYRVINVDVNHRIENGLKSSVEAAVGHHSVDVHLTAENTGSSYQRDLSAKLSVKTSIRNLERVVITANHNDDGRKFDSSLTADMGRHGQYSVLLDMTHEQYSYQMSNNGKLTIRTPFDNIDKLDTSWMCRLRENSIHTSLSSSWGRQELSFKLDASHQHSYDQRTISANLKVRSPLPAVRDLILTLNHNHGNRQLDSSASLVRNRYKKTEYSVSYNIDKDYDIESMAMFTCPGLHQISAKLTTKLSESPLTAEAEVEWSPRDKITFSGELTQHGWRFIDTTITVKSPFQRFERIVASGRHDKEDGVWTTSANLEYAPRQEIDIRTRFSTESLMLGEVTVTTPIYSFQKFKIFAQHTGDVSQSTKSHAQVELIPQLGLIDALATFQNGEEKMGSLRVKTPYGESQSKVTYRPGSVQAVVEYLPNKVVNIDVRYQLHDYRDLSSSLTVTTPISSFDYFKTSFLHRGSWRRSRSEVMVEYPRRNVFSATANYENDERLEVSVDLKAPEYDDVRLTVRHTGSARDFNSHAEITYQRYKKIEGDITFSLKRGRKGPSISLQAIAKSPKTQDINLKLEHEGNIVDFKSNLLASYGRRNKLIYNLGFASAPDNLHADSDFSMASEIVSPMSASVDFNLKGELNDFKGDFEGNLQGKSITSEVEFKLKNGLLSSITLNTPFKPVQHLSASVKHTGSLNAMKSNITLKYNRVVMGGDVSFKKDQGGILATVQANTPFIGYRDISGSFDFVGSLEKFQSNSVIGLPGRKAITLRLNSDMKSNTKTLDARVITPFRRFQKFTFSGSADVAGNPKSASADIRTPFEGFEEMSMVANFNGDAKRFKSDCRLTCRRRTFEMTADVDMESPSKSLRGSLSSQSETIEVRSSLDTESSSKVFSVSVKTPFEGFEDQSALVSVSGEIKRCEVEASLSYGNGKTAAFNGAVDLISQPMTITSRLTTPFPGLESQSISLSYAGSPLNLRTSARIESAKLRKPILASVDFLYDSPMNVQCTASLKSSIPNAETLKFVVKNSNDRKYSSYIEAMWAQGKSVTLDGNFQRVNRWRNSKTAGEVTITTPFNHLRKVATTFERNVQRGKKENVELNIDYENKNVLAIKGNGVAYERLDIEVDMPYPRPMKFKANGNWESDSAEGLLFANWNVRDRHSNVKLTARYNDQSGAYSTNKVIELGVIHPKHTAGFSGKVVKSPRRLVSSGEISWDNKKTSLITEWNDRSQGYVNMYQGKVRLNTPSRSLQLEGSHSDDVDKVSDALEASWDVARDESKKVIMSSVIQKSAKFVKSDFKVEIPYIQKEIRLNSEATLNRGRTLFDGKTELIYSPDGSKTLALSSKIEDNSRGYGDAANYTVTFTLRHPSTKTDIKVVSHAGKSSSRLSAGTEVSYLTTQRRREILQLRGAIDKIQGQLNLEIRSPVKSVDITGHLQSDAGYRLSLHNVYDGRNTIDTTISVNPEEGNIALSMGSDLNDPSKTVNLRAGYSGDKRFLLEAFHSSRRGRVTDGLISFSLNTSRILHTRLHWRPTVMKEIYDELERRYEAYRYKADSAMKEAIADLSSEWKSRINMLSTEVSEDMEPVMAFIDREWNAIDLELARFLEELNKLGLQEVLEAAEEAVYMVKTVADKTLDKMLESYSVLSEKLKAMVESGYNGSLKYKEAVLTALDFLKESLTEAEHSVKEVIQEIVDELERLARAMVDQYSKVESKYRSAVRNARKYTKQASELVLNHPRVQALKDKASDLLAKISNIASPEKIREVSRRIENGARSYSSVLKDTHQKLTETIIKVAQMQEVRQMHSFVNEVYQQGKWAYGYWEVEKNVANFLKSICKNVRELIAGELYELRDSILNLDKSRVIIYDPEHGEIQFEIFLPVPLKSLRALPEESVQKYVKTYKKFANSYIPSRNFSVYDTYYSWKPSSDVLNWLPPFKAHASISGKQHFTTFDGRHFNFAGLCSYVLAYDFMDGNFSVILNYEGDWRNVRKRSMTITVGAKQIDIMPDYKIEVDGRPQELPYQFETTTVERKRETILVKSGKGIEVECDLAHDIYTLTISGWYYGKTAGLFGTYDNEPSNDLIMSSHDIAMNIEDFAHSWEVAGSCRSSRNYAREVVIRKDQPGFEECKKFFMDSTSPFRSCFNQVNPDSVMAKCMEDYRTESLEHRICNSSAQYIRECKRQGVPLSLMPDCVRCEAPNGGIFTPVEHLSLSGSNIRPPRSADVVFVIEEKECNRNAADELHGLVQSIESGLSRRGLTGNMYGIVGYSGSEIHREVHTHTIGGQIMNYARRFGVGVESLIFDKSQVPGDVLRAVLYASNYPFRTGVSKSIILLPCSSCEETETSYPVVKKILQDQGIKLHLLKEHDFEFLSNKSPKSTNIFGISNRRAYTYRSNKSKLDGDSELLGELRVPTDTCIALSQNSNGTLFNLARLTEGRKRMQNSFRDVWSRQVAASADPLDCQVCKCEADEFGVGMSVCTRCDATSLYNSVIQDLMPSSRQKTRPVLQVPSDDDFHSQFKAYMYDR